ncbi:MAG: Uma2 family endonuclease [Acidimicrobiales bacterium]
MKAVLLEVPEHLLEERRRTGADRFDEMWDGVLHMGPPPSGHHQRFGTRLVAVLVPLADDRELVASYETGLARPGAQKTNYRIPDLAFYRREHASEFGIDGRVELAVEIRSPHDETYEKLGFYAEIGVQELLVVHPVTCQVELFALLDGRLELTDADGEGAVSSASLGVSFCAADGPALRVQWPGGTRLVTGDA